MSFDHSVDVLVVGSGGGALTSAIAAQANNADVLVVEKSDEYGGTSAMSGGSIWIPNSHLSGPAGGQDSREDAVEYMLTAIGEAGDRKRIEAYVDFGPKMLKFLEENTHVTFDCQPYSDYYPELPGGKRGYRTHEPNPMHARVLGKDFEAMRKPHHAVVVMDRYSMNNTEGKFLLTQAPGWKMVMAKLMVRYWLDLPMRLRGKRDGRLTMGNALMGRLRWSLNDRKVPVWLSAPMRELIIENNRVRGAVIEKDGKLMRVEARSGVIMGAGGFEHDQAMREQYLPKPTSTEWSASNTNNTGDGIKMGMAAGAATDLMEHAWWIPVIPVPGIARPWAIFAERSLPGLVIVDSKGRRFTNEAAPYLEAGAAIGVHHSPEASSVPAYCVFDNTFRQKYPFGPLAPGALMPDSTLPEGIHKGVMHKADTLSELAKSIGVDAAGLEETVRKNNEYASTGKDQDFQRGDSYYDRYYGDATNEPSPCIGPIEAAPYYAITLYPGDIGTKGGLLTDEYARVLDKNGNVMEGLYAIGNTAASMMGTKYPGAGSTIGPSMVFGYIAARHATRAND